MDTLLLREFLRNPTGIAAITPSSTAVATLLSMAIPQRGEPVVVELGAGTGACTGVILHRLGGRGHHIAVEVNPTFAQLLRKRFHHVEVVCGEAKDLPTFLADRAIPSADVIISTLPWAAFAPSAAPRPLLVTLIQSLSDAGAYIQVAYSLTRWAPPARRQLRQLRASFEEVIVSETIWRNVPPARAYIARRPRSRQEATGRTVHQGRTD